MSRAQSGGASGAPSPASRYKVKFVAANGREEQILALCGPECTVAGLRDEIGRRLLRAGIPVNVSQLQLRLDSRMGPLLDEDDLVSIVLLHQANESIFALETRAVGPDNPRISPAAHTSIPADLGRSQQDWTNGGDVPINVRVVTTHLARFHKDVKEVPVIPSLSSKTTLRQLYERTSQYLGVSSVSSEVDNEGQAHRECNCSLARAIQQGTLFKASSEASTANRFLVIHSKNVVEPIEWTSPEETAVIGAVQTIYGARPGFDLETKQLKFFAPVPSHQGGPSGNEHAVADTANALLISPAIVTICSAKRHQRYEPTNGEDSGDVSLAPSFVLDLHTAESPVRTQNFDLTLEELGLADLAIDGILTVYAVARSRSSTAKVLKGQNEIYLNGPHWELPTKQTERGMAMFLSSLRMAVHLITHGEKAEKAEAHHDSALHILHVLTRFPPAVRALHILLEGSVPTEEECAALVQACYQVIVDMLATSVLATSRERTLEGSRLFFSTVLCKTKEFALKDGDGSMFPYISSMKAVDLTNSETMEPIAFPVDTILGLMEKGCFDALKSGIIQFTEDELNKSLNRTVLDGRTRRAALLSGGTLSTNTMFDMEILYSGSRYTEGFDEAKIIHLGDFTNILFHASNASIAKLQVVAPASLNTAPNPALTLDRDGFLAVYLGRKPCGAPGQDFMTFRPTRGGECDVDTSIVAQLLEPIIAARIADGTAIFDGEFYAAQRRSDKPDEILMICVDCSSSMSESAGFVDAEADNDDSDQTEVEVLLEDIRQNEIYVGTLNDQKEALQDHESFDDMLQTVGACAQSFQRRVAAQVIKHVVDLKIMELMNKEENLEDMRRRVWRDRTGGARQLEDVVQKLRNDIAGILVHESALSEFLIYRGCLITGPGQDTNWKWSGGNAIPNLQTDGTERPHMASTSLDLTVPYELRCPMTQELFREPMTTQDGHTYEAAAIRKWLRIAQTSPLTGLRLPSTQLNVNRPMSLRVNKWVEGTEVLAVTPTRRPFTRRGNVIRINFVSSLTQFTRAISPTTTRSALYELAFRGLRGQYPSFTLDHFGTTVQPDDEPASTLSPGDGIRLTIQLPDSSPAETVVAGGMGTATVGSDLCLVKVYRNTTAASFSYWVRKDSKATVGSVLFKTWRHLAETSQISRDLTDQAIWHSLMYTGDGHMSGRLTSPWTPLSGLLRREYANGVLEAEPLYRSTSDDTGDSISDTVEGGPTGVQPMVLKLYACKSSVRRKGGARTSRLSILKQMFDQFVNRILAYGYSTHLGLISFDSTAKVAQRLSPVVENFRSTVQELQGHGDTALWDALALARDQIQEYSAAYPGVKKRILCISDGIDTNSKSNKASNLWKLLAVDDIVVDSFCLGTDDNSELRTVSYLTNGYKFHPTSLEQAMAICEMEPVLSQLERDIAEISASRQPRLTARRRFALDRFLIAEREATTEIVTQDVFPKRIEHPRLKDNFVELRAVSRRKFADTRGGVSGSATTASSMRTYRILTEMQQIAAHPHPHVDVYVSERDMSFWKVIIEGPPDSIYTGATFVVYLDMEDTYPSFAPKARFVTPIYHPNVNRHGRICHSILDRNWTTDTSNLMVISTIYGLLMEPDYSDPV